MKEWLTLNQTLLKWRWGWYAFAKQTHTNARNVTLFCCYSLLLRHKLMSNSVAVTAIASWILFPLIDSTVSMYTWRWPWLSVSLSVHKLSIWRPDDKIGHTKCQMRPSPLVTTNWSIHAPFLWSRSTMHALTCVSVRGCVIDVCERFVCVFVLTGARLCVCMRGPLPINASQEVKNERFQRFGKYALQTDLRTNGRTD